MNIVYCILDYTPAGGTERTLSVQANYFAERGHEVHIVSTETPQSETPAYTFSKKITFHNLAIHYREVDNSISFKKILSRLNKAKIHRQKLESLLERIHPDITVTLFGHELSFLYKLKDGSIKISQYHFSRHSRAIEFKNNQSNPLLHGFTLFKEWRKRQFINRYAAFVVLTHEDASEWKGVKNLRVIPNAISFTPNTISTCEEKRVISVGRLAVQKGYDMLLKAWEIVACKHNDWILEIYGKGEEHEKLTQIIQENHLGNNVRIYPPTVQIEDCYTQASIYVMSSRYEGFPMVLPEAMACGLPCVSFTAPCGPTEIIQHKVDGFLVKQDDINELAERINFLIEHPAERKKMGEKAHTNITRYSVTNVMKQWENLFKELNIPL